MQTDKPSEIKRLVLENISAEKIKVKQGGVFRFMRSFFYRCDGNSDGWAEIVCTQLREQGFGFTLLASGEVYRSFIGGAPIERQSHWWADVKVTSYDNGADEGEGEQ